MERRFLSNRNYFFFFSLLGIVYIIGLFVPLMDNDSAHHANIALHMYLTGDYVNLVDYGNDYLDKPHLHFWLCAASYHLFGVTGFAYKFPSLVFTIIGTYSTFKLGKRLYSAEVGKLSALIIASAFSYMLANNDVRMDAILTACISIATWQLIAFLQTKKINYALGAALGLALGFCTKGHIAVFTPAVAALFYILYTKDWKVLLNYKWLILLAAFAVIISPVVYCYYLQFNLHPEKVIRGQNNINGVKFILLNQSVERFGGTMGKSGSRDYLFFIHSFLWAFAPWSILTFIAFAKRLKYFLRRNQEWATTGVLGVMLIIISFSGFKLPHYLNICFPVAAVMAAVYIYEIWSTQKKEKALLNLQAVISGLLILAAIVINTWAFPLTSIWLIIITISLLSLVFYVVRSTFFSIIQKAVLMPVAAMVFVFFLLNKNFYPQLLTYQGGNQLAFQTEGIVDAQNVYFWDDHFSSSYNFYTATIRKPFNDSIIQPGKKIWILADVRSVNSIKAKGYLLGKSIEATDYEITRLKLKFIDPSTRLAQCTKMVLVPLITKLETVTTRP